MASLAGTFAADGDASQVLLLKKGQSANYTLESAGLTGSVVLERQGKGAQSWINMATIEDDGDAVSEDVDVINDSTEDWFLRLRCVSIDDDPGTEEVDYTLSDLTTEVLGELAPNVQVIENGIRIVSGTPPDLQTVEVQVVGGTVNVKAGAEGGASVPVVHLVGSEARLGIATHNDNVVGLTREAADEYAVAPCASLGGDVDLGLTARPFRDVKMSGEVKSTSGAGAKNGATVAVSERGDGVLHKTVLTLTATPITLTDYAGDGQAGGVKLYDFPAGNIKILGAVINADVLLDGTEWLDTAAGDVGLGSTVKGDGTALVTTEQDILNTTEVAALVAQAGPIDAQSDEDIQFPSAGGTDLDLFLNLRIDDDAAHVTNDALVTGTVTITWINLGDF